MCFSKVFIFRRIIKEIHSWDILYMFLKLMYYLLMMFVPPYFLFISISLNQLSLLNIFMRTKHF